MVGLSGDGKEVPRGNGREGRRDMGEGFESLRLASCCSSPLSLSSPRCLCCVPVAASVFSMVCVSEEAEGPTFCVEEEDDEWGDDAAIAS